MWTHERGMLKTLWAMVQQGKIELLESSDLPEGVRVLVIILPDDEAQFWVDASQTSQDAVWDNTEDDVYAQQLLA
jgi:hypothetical protein